MTTYEMVIPLLFLALGGAGIAYARYSARRLERRPTRHPAE
jgi:hypothetical protein